MLNRSDLTHWETQNAVKSLQNDGVVLMPTETIWGLGCDATSDKAIRKIFEIKNRPENKKVITLLAEAKDIFQYLSNPPMHILDILMTEKPTTFVFADVMGLSDLVMDNGSAAIRITSNPLIKSIIKQLGKPLVSTSANISGQDFPIDFQNIPEEIKSQVDFTFSPETIEFPMTGAPSQIIRVYSDGSMEVIR